MKPTFTRHSITASLVVMTTGLLTACAVTSPKTEAQLSSENKAMVLGVTENALKEIINPIGSKTNLRFLSLDGRTFDWSFSGGKQPTRLELDPGKHELTLVCKGNMDGMKYEYIVRNFQIEVATGHIYQLKARAYVGGCNVSHTDITKTAVQVDSKPKPKTGSKASTKAESKSAAKPETKTESKTEPKTEPESESKTVSKDEPKTESKTGVKTETKPQPETETPTQTEPPSEPKTEPKSVTNGS